MIQEQYRKARGRITIFITVKRDDSSSSHSLIVRQLDPRRGKNCNIAYRVGWLFRESSDSTARFAFRSRSPARVHFSKGNVRGLIVCVSSALCAGGSSGTGRFRPGARAGSDGDGWPLPGDGNSSSLPALPPAPIPEYNSPSVRRRWALDGPPADSTLCRSPRCGPGIRMSPLDLAHTWLRSMLNSILIPNDTNDNQ